MFCPFALSLSHRDSMEISRNFLMRDDVITLLVDRMCAYVFLFFKNLFAFILNTVNINRQDISKMYTHFVVSLCVWFF